MIDKNLFNEIVNDEYGTYTQVCDKCSKKHDFNEYRLDENTALGLCEVIGCENEASHYLSFK